jgi:glycosyltransferase involved in cell wall biosynthesis
MALSEPVVPRICIVAENASFRFGGEAALPLHYFSRLRARRMEAWLIVHGRTRNELEELFPAETDRIIFIPDRWFHRVIWRMSHHLPRRVSEATFGVLMVLINQYIQRRMIKDLIVRHRVNVVHQPIPVSPRAPSLIFNLGVPVVVGPMNGGMEYPPAFCGSESWTTRIVVALGRHSSNMVNWLIPGKRLAAWVLVANLRTRLALPSGIKGRIVEITENGVDMELWSPGERPPTIDGKRKFVFIGRLVDWKRLDIAIRAIAQVPGATLQVIGDGPMRAQWGELAASLGLAERVSFTGWLAQRECARELQHATALLLPSIFECGGAVVLEAMAAGTPVIVTAWGGPRDYVDDECGILVAPSTEAGLIEGFVAAMKRLINEPSLGKRFRESGLSKIKELFDWDRKLDQLVQIYRESAGHAPS